MSWWRRKQREQDLDRELRSHLEAEAEEQRGAHLSSAEARYSAHRSLGNTTLIKEETRAMWGWTSIDGLGQDTRYALRVLRKTPGFTAVAVLTLALGIGANTAIFSVVDAALLNRLPYPNAGQLVLVWEQNPARGWFRNVISAANFMDWRADNHVFTEMAAIEQGSYDVSGTGEPLEVRGERVSANFFSVLRVQAALGRTFTPVEDQQGGQRVVVLSNELWKQRYGGDTTLVGSEITVNRARFIVIGVLPPDFHFPPWDNKAELWVAGLDLRNPDRVWHNYMSIARLKPGVPMRMAQAEMDTIASRLEKEHPEQKGWGAQLVNLHEQVVGDTRPALLVLLAAAGTVLLIACVNLANLQLARFAGREKEIAVRAALGGGRGRLIRQLLTESVLLAITGGVLGVLLARWGVKLLVTLGPQSTPGLSQAGVNSGVLIFTLVLSVATGIAFGLWPALGASKVDLNHCLQDTSRSSTRGVRGYRLRSILVSSEFALALILLVGAGLLIRTFIALRRVDLGFDPDHMLTMRIALLGPGYTERSRQVEFFRDLLQKVQSLPGIASAAAIDGNGLPPRGGSGMDFLIEGRPTPPPNERPDASYRLISPSYFRTMRIPLMTGRYLTEADSENEPLVAVINERLARDYWPETSPIGRRIVFPGLVGKQQPSWFSIVGVVRSVKNLGVELEPREEIYVSYRQHPAYFVPRTLVVRTFIEPTLVVSAIRQQVDTLDRDQPISEVRTLDQMLVQAEEGHRFPMILLVLFAALALTLAGVGTYGVMSYSVSQRMHEVGIRMALGAQSRDVLRSVIADGMRLAILGLGFGLVGAVAVTRIMTGLLYAVSPADPLTFGAVSLILLAVGSLASYIPARRATKIDPMVVLKDG